MQPCGGSRDRTRTAGEHGLIALGVLQSSSDVGRKGNLAEALEQVQHRGPCVEHDLPTPLPQGLAERGIGLATVDLVVGLGSFRPITTAKVEDHLMHEEAYRIPDATIEALGRAKRVVAVGTTVVRTLESWAATGQAEGRSRLFIRHPYPFAVVDLLLTNFHVPRSSLLVLVDAFVGPRWRDLYSEALRHPYRFLSFGDAMLLTRS